MGRKPGRFFIGCMSNMKKRHLAAPAPMV